MEGPTPFSFANFMAASPTCFAPSRVRACLAVTWPASLCSSAKTNEAAASNERSGGEIVLRAFVFGLELGIALRGFVVCEIGHGAVANAVAQLTEQTMRRDWRLDAVVAQRPSARRADRHGLDAMFGAFHSLRYVAGSARKISNSPCRSTSPVISRG